MVKNAYNRFVTTVKRPQTTTYKHLSIIILGALPSHKMRSYGPKSLFKLSNGEFLIDNQIENIQLAVPDSDVILTVGFCADKVIRQCPNHIRIIENQLYETTNTFEELRLALNNVLSDRVLIIHGEMQFDKNILDRLINTGLSSILIDSKKIMPEDDIGVTVVNEKATILAHDIPLKWGYIAYLTGKELKLFKSVCSDRDKNKLYMFEGINYVLDKGGVIKALEVPHGQFNKMDSPK